MPEAGDSFPAGTKAVVSGWGVTDAGGASDVLMAVDVLIDSDAGIQDFCLNHHDITIKRHFSEVCDGMKMYEDSNHINMFPNII